MICDSCGNSLPANAAFCPRCGKTLSADSAMGTVISDPSNPGRQEAYDNTPYGGSGSNYSYPGNQQPYTSPGAPTYSNSGSYGNQQQPYSNPGESAYPNPVSQSNQQPYSNPGESAYPNPSSQGNPYTVYPAQNPYATPPPPPILPPSRPPNGGGKSGGGGKIIAIVLVVALLVIAACGGLTYGAVNWISSLPSNETPTTTVKNPTATATKPATATPDVEPTTANTTLSLPAGAKLRLDDPLVDNSKNVDWEEFDKDSEDLYCKFENGGYHTRLLEGSKYRTTWCLEKGVTYSNMAYQVDMQQTKGACGGMIFHSDGDKQQYYFCVSPKGGYRLDYYQKVSGSDKSEVKSIASGSNSAIKKGYGTTNTLAVIVDSGTIKLYANGTLIKTAYDDTYSKGQIGVIAYHLSDATATNEKATDAIFKNVKVWTW